MDALVTLQMHKYTNHNEGNGTIRSQYRITIPKRIIKKLLWDETNGQQQQLILTVSGGCLICQKLCPDELQATFPNTSGLPRQ